jgi:hypothetical protein
MIFIGFVLDLLPLSKGSFHLLEKHFSHCLVTTKWQVTFMIEYSIDSGIFALF